MRIEFLEAGEIVTTHGIRGEMKLLPWVDTPEFLLEFDRVRIDEREYTVESCRVQKNCNLLKLKGIDTVEDAMMFRGKTVELYRSDISDELVFAAELIGMDVFEANNCIGRISEVMDYPGNKVYVVQGEHTYMIPAVKAFILSTDLNANRMDVRTIEGMIADES